MACPFTRAFRPLGLPLGKHLVPARWWFDPLGHRPASGGHPRAGGKRPALPSPRTGASGVSHEGPGWTGSSDLAVGNAICRAGFYTGSYAGPRSRPGRPGPVFLSTARFAAHSRDLACVVLPSRGEWHAMNFDPVGQVRGPARGTRELHQQACVLRQAQAARRCGDERSGART